MSESGPALDPRGGARPAWSPAGIFLAAAVPSLAFNLQWCDVGINLADEGAWVSAAWALRRGIEPFADYFFPHPSVLPWVYAALFSWFGEDLLVVRALWAVVRAVAAGLLSVAAARALAAGDEDRSRPRGWPRGMLVAAPPLLLALAGGPWHKTHIALVQAASACLLLVLISRPSAPRALALGLAQGLLDVDLFNDGWVLPGAVLGAAAAIRYLPAASRHALLRAAPAWGLGLLLGTIPMGIAMIPRAEAFHLAQPGGGRVVFEFAWHLRSSFLGWPGLARAVGAGAVPFDVASGLVLDGAALLVAVGLLGWPRCAGPGRSAPGGGSVPAGERGNGAAARAALAGLAAFAMLKVALRADLAHLLQNAGIVSVLGVVVARDVSARLAPRTAGPRAREVAGALAACCGVAGVAAVAAVDESPYYSGTPAIVRTAEVRLPFPHAALRVPREDARDLSVLVERLRAATPRGEPIFALPNCPLLHFLADRPNATRLVWVVPMERGWGPVSRSFVTELEASTPPCIAWEIGRSVHGELERFERLAPELTEYLREAFPRSETIGAFDLRCRADGASPGG